MSLEEFNFDSLIMTSPEDKSGKPPMPIQQPNPSLVNIGPFSLQKLNIPDGFYTNPASWSKSSTGSGHTEHEDDSYRIEREIRMEYWNSLHDAHNSNNNNNNNLSRQISPSVTQIQVMEQDDPRLLGSSARLPYDNSFPPHGGFDLSYSASNRTTPTAASANAHAHEKLQHQLQVQQKYSTQGPDQILPPAINTSGSNLPRSVLLNPYPYSQNSQAPSPKNSVPRSPYAYEFDGVEFTGHSESRTTPRSSMPHYTPSAAVSAAAWRNSVAPATASSMQLRGTPTNASKFASSTPPASPASGYHTGFNQAAQGGVNGLIYQVQFKCALRNYILGSQAHPNIMIGDFVVVEADRGEDIGIVVEVLPMKSFVERRIYMKNTVDDENVIGRILRLASVAERQFLPEKFHDEENIVQFCRELAYGTYRLPMMIHDVEYQFDRHKLTIFYSSDSRVDFREFVRDLFSAYKARIWMKKVGTGKPVRMDNWASVALATGMQFTPDSK